MKLLFDVNLYNHPITIGKDVCHILTQLLIKIDSAYAIKIILIKNGIEKKYLATDKYFIFQIDSKQKIVPVDIKYVNTILTTMKKISFPEMIQTIINQAPYNLVVSPQKGVQQIKLTQSLIIFIRCWQNVLHNIDIGLYFLSEQNIKAESFVFYAFDGIDAHIQTEIKVKTFVELKEWHALAGLSVKINNQDQGTFYPIQIQIIDNEKIIISCQLLMYNILSSTVIGGMHISNLNVYEISDFIISTAGLVDKVTFPNDYKDTSLWFTVIFPIKSLRIEQEFGIGCVHYLKEDSNEIKRIIEFDNTFAGHDSYVLVHVNAPRIYQAYVKGKRQIEQSLDFLLNLLKDDSLYSNHSMSNRLMNKNFEILNMHVTLLSDVYIENPLHSKKLSCNLISSDNQKPVTVSASLIDALVESQKAELLMIKASGDLDKDITPLFSSLKWIRKAWDTNDLEDKIINAVIALEFIVSREQNVPLMAKDLRMLSKKCLEKLVIENFVEVDMGSIDEYIKKVNNEFDRAYSETPFMQKLRNLIARLQIPVSANEISLLADVRTIRNGIIHGRDIHQISMEQIQLICEIISLIAFYKINSISLQTEETI